MKIRYLGHSCFCLQSEAGLRIVTDPYSFIGYNMPNVCADIVTSSHAHYDHDNVSAVEGNPIILNRAGVFSFETVDIFAFPCFHDNRQGALRGANLAFLFEIDGLRVCHLGDLGEEFSERLIEQLLPVDVLLLPVGGTYTIDGVAAKHYVERINPSVVIPMHFKTSDSNIDIAGVDEFLKQFEYPSVDYVKSEWECTAEEMKREEKKIIVMER